MQKRSKRLQKISKVAKDYFAFFISRQVLPLLSISPRPRYTPGGSFNLGGGEGVGVEDRYKDGTFKKGHLGIKGKDNNFWRGNNVGYHGVHSWIKKYYGKANCCENNPNHKAKKYDWANITGVYSRDRKDYKKLCVSCHRKFDKGNFCSKGHEFSKENIWIRKNGWRVCKICQKLRYKRFLNKEVSHL